MAFDSLLAEIGKARTLSRNARHELLEAAGYRSHPALPGGRVKLPDGTTPRLYLAPGAHASEAPEADVVRLYVDAQVG